MSRPAATILIDVVLLGAVALFVLGGATSVPFHGDESTLIFMSRDYHTLVERREPESLRFSERPEDRDRQWLRMMNGSLHPLAVGLAWDVAGFELDDLNGLWDWESARGDGARQWSLNLGNGNRPSEPLLRIGRTVSAFFTAASAILLYAVVLSVSRHRPAAWAAVAVFATAPAVLLNGRRAMQEGMVLFFTVLVALAALAAVRALDRSSASPWERLGALAGLGIASGLALACKHSTVVVVAAALLAVFLAAGRGKDSIRFDWRHLCGVAGVAHLALLVFVLATPIWWSASSIAALAGLSLLLLTLANTPATGGGIAGGRVGRGVCAVALAGIALGFVGASPGFRELGSLPLRLLSERSALIEVQGEWYGARDSMLERARALGTEAFFPELQYFEDPDWEGIEAIRDEIAAYEASPWRGRTGWGWGLAVIAICGVGLAELYRRWNETGALVLGLWLLLPAMALLANPLPWQRYYLIVQAPVAALAGLGVAGIVRWIAALRSKGEAA